MGEDLTVCNSRRTGHDDEWRKNYFGGILSISNEFGTCPERPDGTVGASAFNWHRRAGNKKWDKPFKW